ncbi:MAG: hypothetical protein IJX15_08180 [Ruminiclostridium sp.]|nr:hypothetical protein [Ruminiclostridium sp.]
MKKKLYAVLTAIAVIISVAGCGTEKTTDAVSATTTATEQTTTVSETETNQTSETEETSQADTTTAEATTASEETTTTEAVTVSETVAPETTTATETTTTENTTASTTEATTSKTEATTSATTTTAVTTELKNDNTPVSEMVYEAEDAKLSDSLSITESSSFSGGKAVENFGNDADYVAFAIEIPADGMYDITFVSSGIGSYKENNVIIDGTPVGIFKSENEKLTESVLPSISLSKGSHKIKITKSWGWIRLDCMKINKAEGISDEIYDVGDKLINKNANEATKSLFRYLSDSYGKYVLSGQVCDDGYYGKEFTAIYNETGKRPAILGLDMMDYTPSRTALGARSHAVEKAVEFGDMGGIVTFCWHWNAPTEYLR